MKTLEFQHMENIQGGAPCGSLAQNIAGIACGVTAAGGLIGALIGGPTCLGLLIACTVYR